MPLHSTNSHLTVCTFNRLRIGESLSTGTICTSVCTSVRVGMIHPPATRNIYTDNYTDQCLAAVITISCLLGDVHGSLTCVFTMHHKQVAHDSKRLTHSLWHHSELRIPYTYNRVCTRLIRSPYRGVLDIQVRHVCIGTCIKLRSSYILIMSLKWSLTLY